MEEDSDLMSSPSAAGQGASQPWNLQRSSAQLHARESSGKRRGGEAAANLEGMRRLLEQASGSFDGGKAAQSRVLTRAPAFDPQLHTCRHPASSQIRPHARCALRLYLAARSDCAVRMHFACDNASDHLAVTSRLSQLLGQATFC